MVQIWNEKNQSLEHVEGGQWRRRFFRPFISNFRRQQTVCGGSSSIAEVCDRLGKDRDLWAVAVSKPIARLALQRLVALLCLCAMCISCKIACISCQIACTYASESKRRARLNNAEQQLKKTHMCNFVLTLSSFSCTSAGMQPKHYLVLVAPLLECTTNSVLKISGFSWPYVCMCTCVLKISCVSWNPVSCAIVF